MIQICFISGQLMPNLLSLLQFPVEKVILIHSSDTKDNAESFESFLKDTTHLKEVKLHNVNAFDPEIILSEALKLRNQLKGLSVLFNYTGGTKQQSAIFFKIFSETDAQLIYTDTQQHCFWIMQYLIVEKVPITIRLRFSDLFKLLNFEVKEMADHHDLEELAGLSLFLTKMKKKRGGFILKPLMDKAVSIRVNNESLDSWNPSFNSQQFSIRPAENGIVCFWEGEMLSLRTKLFWNEYFSGGWFEYACYHILQKSGLFHELICNLKISPESKDRSDNVKNEIDIAGISGTIPFFFECKSGKTDQKSITNLKAMRDRYGPSYSHSVLISYWPVKDPVLKTKLDDYQIDLVEGPSRLSEKILNAINHKFVKL